MRRMTIKDFIEYGGPCLECGQKLDLSMCSVIGVQSNMNLIPADIQDNNVVVSLKITYDDALILVIDPKTNKFAVTGDKETFKEYLSDKSLFFSRACKCYTLFQTDYLKFNMEASFIHPTTIVCEMMTVKDQRNMYRLTTFYGNDWASWEERLANMHSELEVTPLNKLLVKTAYNPLKLPILPRYRFKSKEHFLEKIKTYLTFS